MPGDAFYRVALRLFHEAFEAEQQVVFPRHIDGLEAFSDGHPVRAFIETPNYAQWSQKTEQRRNDFLCGRRFPLRRLRVMEAKLADLGGEGGGG